MNKQSESPINLLILKVHYKAILFFTVIGLLLSLVVTYGVMKPKYTASAQLLVNQKLSKSQLAIQAQQTQTDIQRIYTYKDIISSPVIQDTVKKDLSKFPDVKNSKIGVETQQNSQVFTVSATSKNPYTAAAVANKTANVFQTKVKKIMDVNSVTIVSKAKPSLKPTSPHKLINSILGIILGFILGVGYVLIKEINNKKINNIDYLENDLELNNLGIISEIDDKDIKSISTNNIHRKNDHRRRV